MHAAINQPRCLLIGCWLINFTWVHLCTASTFLSVLSYFELLKETKIFSVTFTSSHHYDGLLWLITAIGACDGINRSINQSTDDSLKSNVLALHCSVSLVSHCMRDTSHMTRAPAVHHLLSHCLSVSHIIMSVIRIPALDGKIFRLYSLISASLSLDLLKMSLMY